MVLLAGEARLKQLWVLTQYRSSVLVGARRKSQLLIYEVWAMFLRLKLSTVY